MSIETPVLRIDSNVQDEGKEQWALISFLAFSSIIFVAPQQFFPLLEQIYIGKLLMLITILAYVRSERPQGKLNVISDVRAFWLLVWFLVLGVVSISYSRWPGGSYEHLTGLVVKAAVVFYLAANLVTTTERFMKVCWMFVAYALFNALVGLNNYRTGTLIGFNRISGGFSGVTSNPNDLGLFLDLSLPFIWMACVEAKSFWSRTYALLTLGVSICTVVITFSRGAFVTLAVTGMVFFWNRTKGTRLQYIVITGVLLLLVVPVLPEGYLDRIGSITDSSTDETGSRDERILLMELGVASMFNNPFGVGIGMNQLSSVESGGGWHEIHNAYLQVGVELGFAGLGLYLLLMWRTYQGLSTLEQESVGFYSNAAFAIRLVLIAYAVGAMFGPVAYQFYFFFPGGVALGLKYMADKGNATAHEPIPCVG